MNKDEGYLEMGIEIIITTIAAAFEAFYILVALMALKCAGYVLGCFVLLRIAFYLIGMTAITANSFAQLVLAIRSSIATFAICAAVWLLAGHATSQSISTSAVLLLAAFALVKPIVGYIATAKTHPQQVAAA